MRKRPERKSHKRSPIDIPQAEEPAESKKSKKNKKKDKKPKEETAEEAKQEAPAATTEEKPAE